MFSSLFRPKNGHRFSFSRQRHRKNSAQSPDGIGRYVDEPSEARSSDIQEIDMGAEHARDAEDEGAEDESSEDGADNCDITSLLPIFSAAHLGIQLTHSFP